MRYAVLVSLATMYCATSIVPMTRQLDTSGIEHILIPDTVSMVLVSKAILRAPNEYLGCLVGKIDKDKLTVLRVEDADVVGSWPDSVLAESHPPYGCKTQAGYMGPVHTHSPWPMNIPCTESTRDSHMFIADSRAILRVVMCANGWYYLQLRDGRHLTMQWGSP